ncbi:MAG: glycosyltransferase family 87 protein [Terracidiphilus sp.]
MRGRSSLATWILGASDFNPEQNAMTSPKNINRECPKGAFKKPMSRARLDGLYLVFLGCAIFVILGETLDKITPESMIDFRPPYYSARCLLKNLDPYNDDIVIHDYEQERPNSASELLDLRRSATTLVYLPGLFLLTGPLAIFPFGIAHLIWITVTAGSFILASLLIWDIGASCAPGLSGALLCLCLANSEFLIFLGNPAGIAVSLCVVAVWCFVKERLAIAGVLSFALSLMIKPHDGGLIWLYFLIIGGVYRKRALQILIAVIALSAPTVLWVTRVSPHWLTELRGNLAVLSSHGHLNDPGPSSSGAHSFGMMINLQTVASIIMDDPRFYNLVSYVISGALILVWAIASFRSRARLSPTNIWLALAAIAALTMLPIYHRQSDAKLMLLTIPACAVLYAEGRRIGRIATAVTGAGFLLTGDLWFLAVSSIFIWCFHSTNTGVAAHFFKTLQIISEPLMLLVVGIFYLWVYLARMPAVSGKKIELTLMRKCGVIVPTAENQATP